MRKIVLLLTISLLIVACRKADEPEVVIDYLRQYAFVNESGVQVAVVPKGDYANIPDSLVLKNGGTHTWSLFDSPPISSDYLTPVKVYFNETVVVSYTGLFDLTPLALRDPRNSYFYTYNLLENGRGINIYTFTQEDYQRALEQNKK